MAKLAGINWIFLPLPTRTYVQTILLCASHCCTVAAQPVLAIAAFRNPDEVGADELLIAPASACTKGTWYDFTGYSIGLM